MKKKSSNQELLLALHNSQSTIDSLMTQIEQMKGMFDDSDDAIVDALDNAEDTLESNRKTIAKAERKGE